MRKNIYIQRTTCIVTFHSEGVHLSNLLVLGVEGRYAVVRPARKTVSYLGSMFPIRSLASPLGRKVQRIYSEWRADGNKVSPPTWNHPGEGSSGSLADQWMCCPLRGNICPRTPAVHGGEYVRYEESTTIVFSCLYLLLGNH
jgi:hypothetical protein